MVARLRTGAQGLAGFGVTLISVWYEFRTMRKPVVVAVGGEKGGVGKTCVAINLAAWFASHVPRVALFDADEKPSALMWLAERPAERPRIEGHRARDEVPTRAALLADYDAVVIDAGGGDTDVMRSAMRAADLFIAPFRPAQLDVWKAEFVVDIVNKVRRDNRALEAVAVINCASPMIGRQNEPAEARAVLEQFNDSWQVAATVVRDLKAFVTVQGLGLAVHEFGSLGKLAAAEFEALASELGLARKGKR